MRAISLLLAFSAACGAPTTPRPDVLLVSIDTLRADRLGAWDHERPTSPHLDALAERGVRFAQAHAPSPHTAPSHMSLFTGLDPLAHGIRNSTGGPEQRVPRLAGTVPTLPELLSAAGWRTAAFTDRGNLLPAKGFSRGFDHVKARLQRLPEKLADVRAWLTEQPPDEPLFLFVHTYAVHSPYLPEGEYAGRFTDPSYRGHFRDRYLGLRVKGIHTAWEQARDFLTPFDGMGDGDVAYLSALYDEGILQADAQLEILWSAWDEMRGGDDIIIVTSDHGEELYEHGRFGHARGLNRELAHVPLILIAPGLPARVVETPVSLTAVAPSLLELLGLPPMDAQEDSLLDLARGAGRGQPVHGQDLDSPRHSVVLSVLDDGLRLLHSSGPHRPGSTLYALDDAREEHDLFPERGGEASALRALMSQRQLDGILLQEQHPVQQGVPLDHEQARELEFLGYTGGEDD